MKLHNHTLPLEDVQEEVGGRKLLDCIWVELRTEFTQLWVPVLRHIHIFIYRAFFLPNCSENLITHLINQWHFIPYSKTSTSSYVHQAGGLLTLELSWNTHEPGGPGATHVELPGWGAVHRRPWHLADACDRCSGSSHLHDTDQRVTLGLHAVPADSGNMASKLVLLNLVKGDCGSLRISLLEGF